MVEIVYDKEIAFAEADVIVNAANGCGWMGGKRCQSELHKGVAEHLIAIHKNKTAVNRSGIILSRR